MVRIILMVGHVFFFVLSDWRVSLREDDIDHPLLESSDTFLVPSLLNMIVYLPFTLSTGTRKFDLQLKPP